MERYDVTRRGSVRGSNVIPQGDVAFQVLLIAFNHQPLTAGCIHLFPPNPHKMQITKTFELFILKQNIFSA